MTCPTVLFLKAQIRGGATADLFATPVTIAPHMRDGKLVPAYTAIRHKGRSAQAERMGFAWEQEELPSMTAAQAQDILRREADARANGTIGNEDAATLTHARALVASNDAPKSDTFPGEATQDDKARFVPAAEPARGKPYSAYLIPAEVRAHLLQHFPPRYPEKVGHHITHTYGVPQGSPAPAAPGEARVVGIADDGKGLEALVIEMDGTTRRPDGSTWHITWSKEHDRLPRESNDVIAAHGWRALPEPVGLPGLIPIVDNRTEAPAVMVKPMPKAKAVPPTGGLAEFMAGSVVTEPDGSPRRVYHGAIHFTPETRRDGIVSFDRRWTITQVRRAPSLDAIGSWFSSRPDKGGAGLYSGTSEGGATYPVHLRITRPLVFPRSPARKGWTDPWDDFMDDWNTYHDQAKWDGTLSQEAIALRARNKFHGDPDGYNADLKRRGYERHHHGSS